MWHINNRDYDDLFVVAINLDDQETRAFLILDHNANHSTCL